MFYSCVVQKIQLALDSTVLRRPEKSVAHGLPWMAERCVKAMNEAICGVCEYHVPANAPRAGRERRKVKFR